MKLLVLLIILAIVVTLVWGAYILATQGQDALKDIFRKHRHKHGLWEKQEIRGEDGLEVYVVEPGTEMAQLVEAEDGFGNKLTCARWDGDFDQEIEILRSAANQRLVALNSDRKRLGR